MTENVTQTSTTEQAAPALPELEHLDPRTLTIEANVRAEDVALDPSFVGSIRQHGVLQPILVVRHDDGSLWVRAGQRRTLATLQVGHATIPALIINAGPGAERLIQQIIENTQRKDLRQSEAVAGYEQMHLDFGLSAGQIAGSLGVKKREVTALLRTVTKPAGRQAVAAGLTIDQAATIAAFDHDPDTAEHLTRVAQQAPQRLAHEAQRARDALADARARARLVEDLTAAGIRVLDAAPAQDDPVARPLYRLHDQDGTELDPTAHATCPGHAAYIITGGYVENFQPVVRFACTDFVTGGHQVPVWEARLAPAAEDDAAREAKRAERRRVIEGNKAWRSATVVRREWLTGFAARKSAPKGTAALLGYALTHRHDDLARAAQDGHEMARTLLSLTGDRYSGRQAITDAIDAAAPGRANIITLTVALAAIEDATNDHTWRQPSAHVARYLDALQAWGYTLAPVEQQAAGRTPDTDPDEPAPAATVPGDGAEQDDEPLDDTSDNDEPDAADGQTDPLDLSEYDAA